MFFMLYSRYQIVKFTIIMTAKGDIQVVYGFTLSLSNHVEIPPPQNPKYTVLITNGTT